MTTSQIRCLLSRHLAQVNLQKYYGVRCKDVTKELLGILFIAESDCVTNDVCHALLNNYTCDVVECNEVTEIACTLVIQDGSAAVNPSCTNFNITST